MRCDVTAKLRRQCVVCGLAIRCDRMRLSMDNLDGGGCECHLNCQVENFTDKFHAYSVSIQNTGCRHNCSVASGFADWTRPNRANERDGGEYSGECSRWHAGAA